MRSAIEEFESILGGTEKAPRQAQWAEFLADLERCGRSADASQHHLGGSSGVYKSSKSTSMQRSDAEAAKTAAGQTPAVSIQVSIARGSVSVWLICAMSLKKGTLSVVRPSNDHAKSLYADHNANLCGARSNPTNIIAGFNLRACSPIIRRNLDSGRADECACNLKSALGVQLVSRSKSWCPTLAATGKEKTSMSRRMSILRLSPATVHFGKRKGPPPGVLVTSGAGAAVHCGARTCVRVLSHATEASAVDVNPQSREKFHYIFILANATGKGEASMCVPTADKRLSDVRSDRAVLFMSGHPQLDGGSRLARKRCRCGSIPLTKDR